MTTKEIITALIEYGDGKFPSVQEVSNTCTEAALKLGQLQRFVDDMLGDHYIDYLEFYTDYSRKLEEKLDLINEVLNK